MKNEEYTESVVTVHGQRRITQRVGGPKHKAQIKADKALIAGITHSEATGLLKDYITRTYLLYGTANNIRIYNRNVYLFRNEVLITVLNLPPNLHKIEDAIKAKRKKTSVTV